MICLHGGSISCTSVCMARINLLIAIKNLRMNENNNPRSDLTSSSRLRKSP